MRKLYASLLLLIALLLIAGFALLAQDKKPPEKIVFEAKPGNVTFVHATHLKAVKGDCKVCHDALFQQSKTAPLNFKAGMHKPAEAAKTSCGHCHNAEGPAFETKGNCAKCHVKA
jgi:c(7)-type cytochrome triheme protein